MSDNELLVMAAKAAGIEWTRFDPLPAEFDKKDGRIYRHWGLLVGVTSGMLEGFEDRYWNPLVDDGDALRLAVKLKMDVTVGQSVKVVCATNDGRVSRVVLPLGDDPYAATRHSIVRAAAELAD